MKNIIKGNLFDLKDVAPEVKDKKEIVSVSGITEILAKTGVMHESQEETAVDS